MVLQLQISPRRGELILGRFRAVRPLGRSGWTHLVTDTVRRRLRVLRIIPTRDPLPTRIQRHFKASLRALSGIRDPAFFRFRAVGHRNWLRYVVMDFVEGRSLPKLQDDGLHLSHALVAALGRDIARVLAAVHDAQMVHGDINPRHILVGGDEKGRVVGFPFLDAITRPDRLVYGSPRYRAPELVPGELPDPLAEIYSLGRVLQELNRQPCNTAGGRNDPAEDELFRWGEVDRLLRTMTEIRPSDRPRDMHVVSQDFSGLLSD